MKSIKKQLYDHCSNAVAKNIESSKRGIDAADEAVKSETKGSAGDKHETGRAKIHLERNTSADSTKPSKASGSCKTEILR